VAPSSCGRKGCGSGMVARKRVIGAHVLRKERGAGLRLANGWDLAIELRGDQAEKLLAHMGMGVGQRALAAPLRSARSSARSQSVS
jgi:hypothetical protein